MNEEDYSNAYWSMINFKSLKERSEDFSSIEQPTYNFAKEMHDQTKAVRRHSGEPYMVHPDGVAKIAKAYNGTEQEIRQQICHDTLEDTQQTYDEIKDIQGEDVADIVQELTNDREKIQQIGKENYLNIKMFNLSQSALFCKCCDILYNALDYPMPEQSERMLKNMLYIRNNRKIPFHCKEIFDDTLDTLKYVVEKQKTA